MSGTGADGVVGVIYGFRLNGSAEYRYVGLTTASLRHRTQRHFQSAAAGRKTPFYDWLRKIPKDLIVVEVLEAVTTTRDALGQSEIEWIARLKEQGDRLLNISAGGLGPTGVVWTDEQREAARVRSTGRPGFPRPGEANPFFGRSHTDEQRTRWSEARKGMNRGASNPNYGRFGSEHPSFGHAMSLEARAKLSELRGGALNPNFGKIASEETRAKRSAAQKGIAKPSSTRSAHTRYHTNKSVMKPGCKYCVDQSSESLTRSSTETTGK